MMVLEHITVIDFTQAYSGPFCAMQLADFGARVIKIERTCGGDQSRDWTPFKQGRSGYFASNNRNKESISLDLGTQEGQTIVKELVKDCDILLENFKYGTLTKLGLGYEVLKEINPQLIFASLSGFGRSGDLKHLAAYDNVVQSMSGIMDLTGEAEGEPCRIGPALGDSFSGLVMCHGILLALLHRKRTGEGQCLNVAMLDAMFSLLEHSVLKKSVEGVNLSRTGSENPFFAPYDVLSCQDGLYTIAVTKEEDFLAFAEAIGKKELCDDSRFSSNAQRLVHRKELLQEIQGFFKEKSSLELDTLFETYGISGAPVLSIPDIMNHPQISSRSMLWDTQDPVMGLYKNMANPIKLSETPATLRSPAPSLGQHSRDILLDLGYSEEEISRFREKAVIV